MSNDRRASHPLIADHGSVQQLSWHLHKAGGHLMQGIISNYVNSGF